MISRYSRYCVYRMNSNDGHDRRAASCGQVLVGLWDYMPSYYSNILPQLLPQPDTPLLTECVCGHAGGACCEQQRDCSTYGEGQDREDSAGAGGSPHQSGAAAYSRLCEHLPGPDCHQPPAAYHHPPLGGPGPAQALQAQAQG